MNERRRDLLLLLGGTALSACATTMQGPRVSANTERELGEVTAPEDLMYEHGVLRRVLLVYAEASRRLRAGEALDPAHVARAATIVQTIVEQHHERDEERYVFPVLRDDPKVGPLITVLLAQHVRGREVTAEILRLASSGPTVDTTRAQRIADLCDGFARMYHPHAAHEDTVVFPALRAVLGRHAIWELGERMEHAEGEAAAEAAFEAALTDLHRIDVALGIADLARFTPPPVGA